MTMRCWLPLLTLAGALLVGCGQGRPDRGAQEEAGSLAEVASGKLGKALFTELSRALSEGNHADAVNVCASVATSVSDTIASENGVEIGRTALRVRNPQNAPDEWESQVLERWDAHPEERGVVSELFRQEGRWVLRQMRPIETAGVCTGCHGAPDSFSRELRETIAQHYPRDRAVDFQVGDLRGAFTVTVPID